LHGSYFFADLFGIGWLYHAVKLKILAPSLR